MIKILNYIAMNTNLMLRSGRNFKNKFWQKQNDFIALPVVAKLHVQIPPRIERGPIDILKALSSTVKAETQFDEYKYQYGRAFNISTVYRKRITSLSMESGRKAAKWIVDENPTIFQHRSSDPYIKAYSPPEIFDENSEVSEEILIQMIQEIKVTAAIKVYELLQKKGLDISNSTKQQLLELVCFYNNTDKEDETLLETKYFENQQIENSNTWDSQGFSMKLFSGMERNVASYSAVILGMLKYNNFSDAMALYEEAEDESIKFDIDVYNAVLECALCDSYQWPKRKEYIMNMLSKMEKENIEPNVETLNSVLKSVLDMKQWFKSREFAWSLFFEFTRIGIKPSLSTYYYLLEIFLDRKNINNILSFVLDEMEKQEFILQHKDDFKLFPKLMEKCSYNFKSVPMAYKIHNLLNTGNNRDFLCSHFHEANYYRCYLRTLFENENLDKALKVYVDLVPSTFLPDIGTLIILLEFLKLRKGIQCLPRLWEDIKKMTLSDSGKILHLVVSVVEEAGSDSTKEKDSIIVKEAWQNIEKGVMKTSWNSELVSSFVKIFSRTEDKDMAFTAFDYADCLKISNLVLDFESRKLFMQLCIKVQDKERAMQCIEYSAEIRDENMETLEKLFMNGFKLETKDFERLKNATANCQIEEIM